MPTTRRALLPPPVAQRGGTLLGLIIGLVLGLGIALAAATYMNRAALPFMNRYQQRPVSAASEAANWKPNSVISGGATPPAAVTGGNQPGQVASAPLSARAIAALGQPASGVLGAQGAQAGGVAPTLPPAVGSSPAPATAGLVQYILQIGAYSHRADAESQRAKVALAGLEAHLDERVIGGRTLWRVRVGPYLNPQQADAAQKALNQHGIGSALVRLGS